jgi:hypothetical protein
MEIKVMGPGCAKCAEVGKMIEGVAAESGIGGHH